ncbi:MAG: transposase [Xenococcaceae cyanobacterium MO_167.B27]|nr:transposase [Xenococcaceae cyanobacterium MO_167.B27]
MILRKTYKFRLKTNKTLTRKLSQFAGCSRLVWNKALAFQKERLNAKQSCLSYSGLTKELTQWKKQEDLFFLKEVHSQALQQSLKNLSQALKEAFDKTNPKQFPKFKKKGQRDSFRYPQGFKIDNNNGRIFLPKIGWVRYYKSQNVIGEAKNVTVSKKGQHWFVSIQVEIDVEIPKHPSSSIIGADLGVVRFLTLSNQKYYEPLNIFKKLKNKLAKLQKKLAKKEKFSNKWKRLKFKITKLHIRIANIRNDYLHKISSELSQNHAIVILEDLKIVNMSKSAKGTVENPGKNVKQKSGLNRAILDQGWREFIRQLEYKLTWSGGQLIQVNPRNTSRKCPKCNYISAENRKTQATFYCQQKDCNYTANADYVGSLNIREAGLALLGLGGSSLEHLLKSQPTEGV